MFYCLFTHFEQFGKYWGSFIKVNQRLAAKIDSFVDLQSWTLMNWSQSKCGTEQHGFKPPNGLLINSSEWPKYHPERAFILITRSYLWRCSNVSQRWVAATLNFDSRGFNGRFLTIKLITSLFNLLFSVSQRVQRPRVQIFYLLTGGAEEAVRDVNGYGNQKNERTGRAERSSGWRALITCWSPW